MGRFQLKVNMEVFTTLNFSSMQPGACTANYIVLILRTDILLFQLQQTTDNYCIYKSHYLLFNACYTNKTL
jgi:hypothetical protein